MSQQKMFTSFISNASVQTISASVPKSISSKHIETSQDVVFDERPPNVILNPDEIVHPCLSIDSDHSLLKMNWANLL
jgi:hypothetical protein